MGRRPSYRRAILKSRYPTVEEGNFLRENAPVKPIAIEAAAGSLIAWHGATWHGSYPRENAGLRLNVIMVFTRVYMKQIRDFRSTIPKDVLDRHPVEFARLIGANSAYPVPGRQGARSRRYGLHVRRSPQPMGLNCPTGDSPRPRVGGARAPQLRAMSGM